MDADSSIKRQQSRLRVRNGIDLFMFFFAWFGFFAFLALLCQMLPKRWMGVAVALAGVVSTAVMANLVVVRLRCGPVDIERLPNRLETEPEEEPQHDASHGPDTASAEPGQ